VSCAQLVKKTVHVIQWALLHVSFEVLLKCDDDTVVHMSRLWQWLAHLGHQQWPDLYAGHILRNGTVVRQTEDKWFVPYSLYASPAYPPYASGGGYLLGQRAAKAIALSARAWLHKHEELLPVEDAFMGVLAASAGIVPSPIPRFVDAVATTDGLGPLSTAILIHGVHRWMDAETWSKSIVDTRKSCDCAALTALCAHQDVTHGCWYSCCIATSTRRRMPKRCDASGQHAGAVHYLVISMERSASTTLCWALGRHGDVQCDYELLKRFQTGLTLHSPLGKLWNVHQLLASRPTATEADMCRLHLRSALTIYATTHCHAQSCGFTLAPRHLICAADGRLIDRQSGWRQLMEYLLASNQPAGCGTKIVLLQTRETSAAHAHPPRVPDPLASGEDLSVVDSVDATNMHRSHDQLGPVEQDASMRRSFPTVEAQFVRQGLDVLTIFAEDMWQQESAGERASRLTPELNLTLLNRVAVFIGVAPVLRQGDVVNASMMSRMERLPGKRIPGHFQDFLGSVRASEKPDRASGRPPNPRMLRCYAIRNPDLLSSFCKGNLTMCNWKGLALHMTTFAIKEKRPTGCDLDSHSRQDD
jgi:hypothetical protein